MTAHIAEDQKLADILHKNYLLIPVVNRLGIRLGFGEKTVASVCAEHGIASEFFIAMLEAFGSDNYAAARRLQPEHVQMIVGYLRQTHAYYRQVEIPAIEALIDRLLCSGGRKRRRNLQPVGRFFNEYKKELLLHLEREDTTTFPYVERVYAEYFGMPRNRTPRSGVRKRYSMRIYEREHTGMDEKLDDLKNVIIKYITGEFDEAACNAVVFELYRLEKDIRDHTHIEDHILVPLVMKMEHAAGGGRGMLRSGSVEAPSVATPQRAAIPLNEKYSEEEIVERLGMMFALMGEAPAGAGDAESLTARETDVLRCVARGLLNKQIADALSISTHTVISHRKNITAKLGIKTVSGLTMYALLNGLITAKES